jgi:hypothetical protein
MYYSIIWTWKCIALKTIQSSCNSVVMQAASSSQINSCWLSGLEMAASAVSNVCIVWPGNCKLALAGQVSAHLKLLPVLVRLKQWVPSECNAFLVYIHFCCCLCVFRCRNVWRRRWRCILGFRRDIFTKAA